MNIASTMLEYLRCPESGSELQELVADQLTKLNELIDQKKLFNQTGQTIEDKFESALINEARTLIYGIRGGIVCLVADQAVSARGIELSNE